MSSFIQYISNTDVLLGHFMFFMFYFVGSMSGKPNYPFGT